MNLMNAIINSNTPELMNCKKAIKKSHPVFGNLIQIPMTGSRPLAKPLAPPFRRNGFRL
jgi:hypothetical protein